jgi:hypothetical protein
LRALLLNKSKTKKRYCSMRKGKRRNEENEREIGERKGMEGREEERQY